MSTPPSNPPLTDGEVTRRLWQWAEVTALSLSLKEAAIRAEFPNLADADIRTKLQEHLAIHRQQRLPKE